jgi:hypothetical protein
LVARCFLELEAAGEMAAFILYVGHLRQPRKKAGSPESSISVEQRFKDWYASSKKAKRVIEIENNNSYNLPVSKEVN